jgi:glutathione-regulated potassium-efflux system ancillary protein KefG
MKEWLDSVLELGWAYGEGGDKLRGKSWIHAISTGGPEVAYHRTGNNRFTMQELLRSFEQSARLCGMHYLEPFVTHGSFRLSDNDRADQADRYRQLLFAMTRGQLPAECLTYEGEKMGR